MRHLGGRAGWALAAIVIAVLILVGASLGRPVDPPTANASQAATPGRSPAGSAASPTAAPGTAPVATEPLETPSAAGDYLLMPRAELQALPTSGPAWDYVVETARSRWPRPNFNDQDNQTNTLALAAALVYARIGDESLRAKARAAIMAVIPTFDRSNLRSGLGPLRQTAGWVLAADLIDLDGEDERVFGAFLERVLTERTGRHPRWHGVVATHNDSSNNWGGWAGAARIAAGLYLGQDITDAANTFRGFLGDRRAWSRFHGQIDPIPFPAADWACESRQRGFTPVNGPCRNSGINLDGAVPADISREGRPLAWPPSETGIMYTLETLAGYSLQAELLHRNGYPDSWEVEAQALRRMADVVSRSEAAGGPGWNPGRVQYHVPWLLNARYDTDYPTVPAAFGRSFGFTDWLYGS